MFMQDKTRAQPLNLRFALAQNELITYKPSAHHDVLIAGAYGKIVDEEAVFNVIPNGALSGLMIAVHPPSKAYYKVNELGLIWFLAWFEPNQILGQLMALWVAKERRQSKIGLAAVIEVLGRGLNDYGEIVAVTSNEVIVDGAQELGYDVIGKIDATRDRDARWILHLTRKVG